MPNAQMLQYSPNEDLKNETMKKYVEKNEEVKETHLFFGQLLPKSLSLFLIRCNTSFLSLLC